MKNIKYIVHALVACIALGNLPMDAMRSQNKPQRRIPAPSGTKPTTSPGAEAAVNRLLAQDISKMNDEAFQAWQLQVLTYIQQMGNRPAARTLFNRYVDKVELQASQRAVDIVIAQQEQQTPSIPPIAIGQSQGGSQQETQAAQRPETQQNIPVERQQQMPTAVGIMQLIRDLEDIGALGATKEAATKLKKIKTALQNDTLAQGALLIGLKQHLFSQTAVNDLFLKAIETFKEDLPENPVPVLKEGILNLQDTGYALLNLIDAGAFSDQEAIKAQATAEVMISDAYMFALKVLEASISRADTILATQNNAINELVKKRQAYNIALDFNKYVSNDNDKSQSLFDITMFITQQLYSATVAGNKQMVNDITAYVKSLKEIPELLNSHPKDFINLRTYYRDTVKYVSSFMNRAYTFLNTVSKELNNVLQYTLTQANAVSKAEDLNIINAIEAALEPDRPPQLANFLNVLNNLLIINEKLSSIFADKANQFPQQQLFYDLQAAMEQTYKEAQKAAKTIEAIRINQ